MAGCDTIWFPTYSGYLAFRLSISHPRVLNKKTRGGDKQNRDSRSDETNTPGSHMIKRQCKWSREYGNTIIDAFVAAVIPHNLWQEMKRAVEHTNIVFESEKCLG